MEIGILLVSTPNAMKSNDCKQAPIVTKCRCLPFFVARHFIYFYLWTGLTYCVTPGPCTLHEKQWTWPWALSYCLGTSCRSKGVPRYTVTTSNSSKTVNRDWSQKILKWLIRLVKLVIHYLFSTAMIFHTQQVQSRGWWLTLRKSGI